MMTCKITVAHKNMQMSISSMHAFWIIVAALLGAEVTSAIVGSEVMKEGIQREDYPQLTVEQGQIDYLPKLEPQDRESKLREMSNLYQMLQDVASQRDMEYRLPQGPVFSPDDYRDPEDDGTAKGKRGSYMSLCHFKICNMGRKRNLRFNPLLRL